MVFAICIYYLSFLSFTCNHLQKHFFTTGTSHSMTGWSVNSITGVTVLVKWRWLVYMIFWHIATFFDVASLFSNSKIVNVIISSYVFPLLNWVIKLILNWGTVWRMEIPKQCTREKIFLHNKTIIFSLLTHFAFLSVLPHKIATYDTHSFLLLDHNFYVFSPFMTDD